MADIEKDLEAKIGRGRDRMQEGAPLANECLQFWRGNHYVYRTKDNFLTQQSTTTDLSGGGKPRHRMRTVRNLLLDVVAHEVSAATSRTPSYEGNPSTTDPQDISAARLAERVALYGYDQWRILKATQDTVTYAVVADEGFAWPYWDTNIGPFMEDGTGRGDVSVRIFGRNEVFWEPAVRFEESRWIAVEQARDLEDVKELDGYKGGKLTPDAETTGKYGKEEYAEQSRLVMVTDYLERPSRSHPNGRWRTFANKKEIQPERVYPLLDGEGNVLDEPVLHKLAYFSDPDNDRDFGLVRHLLDASRTINDCVNKQLEWKNLALNPQVFVINGMLDQPLNDEPGAIYQVQAMSGEAGVEFRPVPPIPQELSQIKDDAINDIARMSAQNDIPSQVESGKAIQSLIERDATRRQNFLANLADFHSRLMRHCLNLVQLHYTEERLLKVRGEESDFELIRDFMGSDLRSQVDVRVYPSSIEPRTKADIEAKILAFADRQWITPEMAMQAINNGSAESLLRSYEQDIARARLVIQKIKDGPEFLFNGSERRALFGELPEFVIDPQSGQAVPNPESTVPSWMPRPFDNIRVHKSVFEDFMKTSVYDGLEPGMQEAVNGYYEALLQLEAKQMAEEQAQQIQLAQELGESNATRPPSAGMPSQPSPENQTPSQ